MGSSGAVFRSWMNDRAVVYRKLNKIPVEWGTAVNVQAMVFLVIWKYIRYRRCVYKKSFQTATTNYGEYLMNAQVKT